MQLDRGKTTKAILVKENFYEYNYTSSMSCKTKSSLAFYLKFNLRKNLIKKKNYQYSD